ncbi:lipase domain-containing protein [Rhizoctonia solani AG-1 IA]|uniref:Lipase domain-containing protein n=1 Tax=Thanatephorus cucumeris (strain AG1-IA) TaxID=983506 RepID=L8X2W4_THACA|nr:lipase domain-containing protein [Rhizoctonia solani AG-1 IA]
MLSLLSVLTLTFPFGAFSAMPDVSSVIGSVDKDAQLIKVGDVTPLSSSEVNSYVPYGWFASAAYCPPKSRDNCRVKRILSRIFNYTSMAETETKNSTVSRYVGWWPSHNSVVVGRQGTDFEKLYAAPPLHCVPRQLTFVDSSWPVITDVTLVQVPTDRFPMCSNEATIHLGFLESHKRSIDSISGAVEDILKEHHGAQMITVGHSLGAALATLDGMYMKQKLGYNVEVITRTFGGPRVGNKAFADCVDATVS